MLDILGYYLLDPQGDAVNVLGWESLSGNYFLWQTLYGKIDVEHTRTTLPSRSPRGCGQSIRMGTPVRQLLVVTTHYTLIQYIMLQDSLFSSYFVAFSHSQSVTIYVDPPPKQTPN